jgi:gamma-glutamylcyclotransferase
MPDTFLYFAYGSNMLSRRLRARTPSAMARGTGFVEGYGLTFGKLSIDGSGKCTINRTTNPGDRVYGVLFDIDVGEAEALDRAEGLGKGYQKAEVRVVGEAATQVARAYIADRTDPTLCPYDWYKDFVVYGAIEHGLPAIYVRSIQQVNAMPDTDAERSGKNRALLNRC